MQLTATQEDIRYVLDRVCNGGYILDVGCADGSTVNKVLDFTGKKARYNYIGLDSVYWTKKPIKVNPLTGEWYVCGDALSLPFKTNSFDLIIISHVMEHIVDIDSLLQEIGRVIKDTGWLLVIVPLENTKTISGFFHKYCNPWKNLRMLLKKVGLKYELPSPHVNFMTYREYLTVLEEKFCVQESYSRGTFFPFVYYFKSYHWFDISLQGESLESLKEMFS